MLLYINICANHLMRTSMTHMCVYFVLNMNERIVCILYTVVADWNELFGCSFFAHIKIILCMKCSTVFDSYSDDVCGWVIALLMLNTDQKYNRDGKRLQSISIDNSNIIINGSSILYFGSINFISQMEHTFSVLLKSDLQSFCLVVSMREHTHPYGD